MAKRRTRWLSSIPTHIKAVAGVISACGVIASGMVAFSDCIKGIIVSEVSDRLDALNYELKDIKQDTVRLQLITMIENDPQNVESILKIAKKYFLELKGDWYATSIFQNWANEHNIDISAFGHLK